MTFLIDYWSNDILEYFDGICKFVLWQKHSFSPVNFILEKISHLVLLLYYIIILYIYLFSLQINNYLSYLLYLILTLYSTKLTSE